MKGGDSIPVPTSAGKGEPKNETIAIGNNSAIGSSGTVTAGVKGPYANLGAHVENVNGYDVLKFAIQPNGSVITNQETMSYMDGGLSTSATLGSSGFFGALLRGVTGSSVLQNAVVNPTQNVLKMVLSPLMQGSILQIDVKPGETWRFSDKSFMACTPNLNVSGNINIFSNFRLMFVGENLTYTTISASDSPGTVWISSFGAIEKHELQMGTGSTVPLFINNGCFLGMLDNNGAINFWNDYVTVGTANGLFSAMFTQLGWIMKIQDTSPPRRPGPVVCTVYTQSLNPHNFEKYIAHIAQQVVDRSRTGSSSSYLTSGVGQSANPALLGTAAGVGLGAAGMGAIAPAPNTAALAGLNLSALGPAGMGAADGLAPPAMNMAPAMNAPAMNYAPPQDQQQGGTRRRRSRRSRGTRSTRRR
uniref:Altered inheritance of mitochondria protein 24, mitochondrial n=1 Tax=viral metagenome TaxID=1070528 RepID=A0A6C0L006_9ZZZZ